MLKIFDYGVLGYAAVPVLRKEVFNPGDRSEY
jgi:hypothetical protein